MFRTFVLNVIHPASNVKNFERELMNLTLKIRGGSAFYKWISATICLLLFFTVNAYANGAAAWPGISGNEMTIPESKPFNNFIVDEEVIIDGVNNNVSVLYSITNTSAQVRDFTMVFPIAEYCTIVAERENIAKDKVAETLVKFNAKLDGENLQVKKVEPNEIELVGEYAKLKDNICSLLKFKVKVLPGPHVLAIRYNLVPGGFQGDGLGVDWEYNYAIWPAKNWVPKFRKALWRVILPKRIHYSEFAHEQDDWYRGYYNNPNLEKDISDDGLYKRTIEITAPGTRYDFSDHIDFTAQNFIPKDQISIKVSMRSLWSSIKKCDEEDNDCGSKAIKSLLKIRPFLGSKQCYKLHDLEVFPLYMDLKFTPEALPYLRNEIFARKGYVFKTEAMKSFFSEMPWYKPVTEKVELTDIEKWNVNFLKKVEDELKSLKSEDEYGDKLKDIYLHMKNSCPDQTRENAVK